MTAVLWIVAGLIGFAALACLAIIGPEAAGFVKYMAASARRWFE